MTLSSNEKYKLQEEFCKERNFPLFAAQYCYSCKNDIYEKITEEKAKTTLITGCPYCCISFID